MTRTIERTPTEHAQLTAAARQAGLDPAALARKLVTEPLPPVTSDTPEAPTLALFAQWDADEAQMTPEDIAAAQRDSDAFTQRMHAERARSGARLLSPGGGCSAAMRVPSGASRSGGVWPLLRPGARGERTVSTRVRASSCRQARLMKSVARWNAGTPPRA